MGFDDSKIVVSGYDLGRGAYPRFRSGSVYRHGKRTNLSVYSIVDQDRKAVAKKEPEKAPEAKPAETATEQVKEEPQKQEKEVPEDANANKQQSVADSEVKN